MDTVKHTHGDTQTQWHIGMMCPKRGTVCHQGYRHVLLYCVVLPKMRSAFIPTEKHFCRRQEGQKRRVCTVMEHSPLNRHVLRWNTQPKSCWSPKWTGTCYTETQPKKLLVKQVISSLIPDLKAWVKSIKLHHNYSAFKYYLSVTQQCSTLQEKTFNFCLFRIIDPSLQTTF